MYLFYLLIYSGVSIVVKHEMSFVLGQSNRQTLVSLNCCLFQSY